MSRTCSFLRAVALVAAIAGFGIGFIARASFVTTPPAAYPFKLGKLDLAVARDADIAQPNDGSVFGLGLDTGVVRKVLEQAGLSGDTIPMSIDVLVIRMPSRIILIDAGIGPTGKGVLPASLSQLGIAPPDVTDVFITHSHHDHTGGLVDADGKPMFPNATIRISAREWASVLGNPAAKAQMASVASRVKTFEPGRPVLPGITPVAAYGHTPGHVGYQISSHGQRLLVAGDTVHSSILSVGHPEWNEGYDNDKPAGRAARLASINAWRSNRTQLFVGHFPFPGLGHIETSSGHDIWVPRAFDAVAVDDHLRRPACGRNDGVALTGDACHHSQADHLR